MKPSVLITCVGEPVADFVSLKSRVGLSESPGFLKVGGGEAANVAVGLARLGTPSAFVGKVGNDSFGMFLASELQRAGVDIRGLCYDTTYKTRLAFVSLRNSGDREFEFWERKPAGEQLRLSEVRIKVIAVSRIVNIGPLLLMKEPSRSTALWIAKEARRRGCDVAFDPNLRLSLWASNAEAKRVITRMARLSTILRMNEEEGRFLTGEGKLDSMAEAVRSYGPELVVVTRGSRGCYFQTSNSSGPVRGFRVRSVDTTGCGDGFLAGLLHGLGESDHVLGEIPVEILSSICRYANAVGALTAMKRGAMPALPYARKVRRFLNKNSVAS
jgi:sugar/nucleoside kinase (ribokinase family)